MRSRRSSTGCRRERAPGRWTSRGTSSSDCRGISFALERRTCCGTVLACRRWQGLTIEWWSSPAGRVSRSPKGFRRSRRHQRGGVLGGCWPMHSIRWQRRYAFVPRRLRAGGGRRGRALRRRSRAGGCRPESYQPPPRRWTDATDMQGPTKPAPRAPACTAMAETSAVVARAMLSHGWLDTLLRVWRGFAFAKPYLRERRDTLSNVSQHFPLARPAGPSRWPVPMARPAGPSRWPASDDLPAPCGPRHASLRIPASRRTLL